MQHRRSITSSFTDAPRINKTLLKSTNKKSKRASKPYNMAGISSKLYSSSRERGELAIPPHNTPLPLNEGSTKVDSTSDCPNTLLLSVYNTGQENKYTF